MNETVRKVRSALAVPPATVAGLWVTAFLAGTMMGILAQFLRQIRGGPMVLGAATAPWVMVGFLLAVRASRGDRTPGKAILVATGTVAAYLTAWLVSYHLLFVVRESVSLGAGWHQTAPWLLIAVPASPVLGTLAALSHKRGLLGDVCLAVPIAGSMPEALRTLQEGWAVGAAVVAPMAVLIVLLISMAVQERSVRVTTLLAAVVTLGGLGIALYSVLWSVLSRF